MAEIHSRVVKRDLARSGFLENEKSQWTPVQKLTWLGFVINLEDNRIDIPPDKVAQLRQLISKALGARTVTARFAAKIVGKVISMSPALGNITRLMTRNMYNCIVQRKSWDGPVRLGLEQKSELVFWLKNLPSLERVKIGTPSTKPEIVVMTDASASAAAGVIQSSGEVMVKNWSANEKLLSSTWRELKAIQLSLESFVGMLKGKAVQFKTDNQAAPRIIAVGSPKNQLQTIALSIFHIAIKNGIQLSAVWFPREENKIADFWSRQFDHDDWIVSDTVKNRLFQVWGIPTIDRFANDDNTVVPAFNSKYWVPGTSGVNALSQCWDNHLNWCCPPVNLAVAALQRAAESSAQCIFVLPHWQSAMFWPLVIEFFVAGRVKDHMIIKSGAFADGSVKGSTLGSNFKGEAIALFLS